MRRMRSITQLAVVAFVFAALAPAHAQTDAERRAKVAVRVGTTAVTVGEVEDRLAAIPPFQLKTWGANKDAVVKKYIDDVIVRDLLLSGGAAERNLAKEQPWDHQMKRVLSSATLRHLHADLPSPNAIPAADVKKFYDDNRTRFDSPERVNVWRILCKSKDEADTVLAAAKKEPTITKFNDLAREHSIDKATSLRGGNLGFLSADGTSNEAGLKVDPAIVQAAAQVKDGEFVAQPISEAGAFAVIWRRATVPANKRTLEESTAQIRTTLYRERTEASEKKLMADLRAKNVKDVNLDLLKIVELGASDASLNIPRSPPKPAPHKDAQ